jgi:hypothetical protein
VAIAVAGHAMCFVDDEHVGAAGGDTRQTSGLDAAIDATDARSPVDAAGSATGVDARRRGRRVQPKMASSRAH